MGEVGGDEGLGLGVDDVLMSTNGVTFMFLDILTIGTIVIIYSELAIYQIKNGPSLPMVRKFWICLVFFLTIEFMAFCSLFAPLIQCHFNMYLISIQGTEFIVMFINTTFLILSGYFVNVCTWSMYLYQPYMFMLSLMICMILAFSFIMTEFNEIKASNTAFNTNCFKTSMLTLEASRGVWGVEVRKMRD